jgi:hypothetical protein
MSVGQPVMIIEDYDGADHYIDHFTYMVWVLASL